MGEVRSKGKVSNRLNFPEKYAVVDPEILIVKEWYDLDPLMVESIKNNGIKRKVIATEDGEVIAGKKRVLIARILKIEAIEVKIIPNNLDEFEYELINLLDNLSFNNLTWHEKVKLQARFHEIAKEENPKQTLKDSAQILGCSISLLSENMTLARAMENDNNIINQQDRAIALKYVLSNNKKSIKEGTIALTETNILFGQPSEVLKLFQDKCFDLVIIDELFALNEIYRVMKNDSFLFYIGNYPTTSFLLPFDYQTYPIIWFKDLVEPKLNWQTSPNYSFIILGVKGSPSLTVAKVNSGFYGNYKSLLKWLIEISTYQGNNILQTFSKNSTLGIACKELGRNFTLISPDIEIIELLNKELE